eukprot:jgi/Tetstr1/426879/TSEL_017092.t1
MADGKEAMDPATVVMPADSSDETPAEPTELTRDTTTLALLQALALKVDALSTRVDEHDDNKNKKQPDIPSDDDESARVARSRGRTPGQPLAHLRRFKAKKALTPEEQVAERLIYSRVFDTAEHERSANVVDGLLAALEDKRLEVGLAAAAKAQASATFKRQAAERDTDRDKARKEKDKAAAREAGAATPRGGRQAPRQERRHDRRQDTRLTEKSSCAWWVSRAFFVPKPGDNQWRFIIDLRGLNTFCARKRLRMETLMGVRHLTAKGDYMFSFDLQDGFYALGIAPSDRDYFTSNIRGTLYRLCGLPMGWSLSPYYFTTFTMTFVKHLRSPTTPAAPGNVPRSRRWLRRGRWRGARILPYVDDFLLFASSEPEALELRQRVADLLDSLGLLRNPDKGLWEPV